MSKIFSSKKSQLSTLQKSILVIVGTLVVLSIMFMLVKSIWASLKERARLAEDYDGDGIANQFDKCCPKTCNPQYVEVNRDINSAFYGCTRYQAPTQCDYKVEPEKDVQCKLRPPEEPMMDYDGDGIKNEEDKCCAAACRPKSGESVESSQKTSDYYGCTATQGPTPCYSDVTYLCNVRETDPNISSLK